MRIISRKIRWVIIVIVLIILASSIKISLKRNENNKQLAVDYANKLVLIQDKDYNEDIIDGIRSRLSQVPTDYLKVLYDKQVYIETFNGPLTSHQVFLMNIYLKDNKDYNKDTVGLFLGDKILLRIDKEYFPGTEIHEVGHAVDNILFNNISNSDEFKDLFEDEGNKLFSDRQQYFIKNPQEYFAECFNYYYYGYTTRKDLKNKAPKTYKFIKTLENNKIVEN